MYSPKDKLLIKLAAYSAIINSIIVILLKLYGWIITNSSAIFASLVDSGLDITASIINMLAIRIALSPPDDNHRFGHEKVGDLAVFGQSIFFIIAGVSIIGSSIVKYIIGAPINHDAIGIYVMIAASFTTFLLVLFQSYVVHRTKYNVISADKLHYLMDFFTNIAVIISFYIMQYYSYLWIDAVFGVSIGSYIVYSSSSLFKESITNLTDQEFVDGDKEKIIRIIKGYKEVKGIHELKTRQAGNKPFIQFHLELDGSISLSNAHNISEKIAKAIEREFKGAEIIIHQDPAGHETDVNFRENL